MSSFEGDAFISYAHLDNIELIEGHKGWVAGLHRALEIRVAQLLGKQSRIWWDPKLQGNDVFAETLVERLQRVATLVSVVSPRYVKSEWGKKEIVEFCRAADQHGGVHVRDKARIFKVLKTPVPLDHHPPELRELLGYEFFKIDSETGKVRELDEIFGPEAQRDFWLKLDDLAHDMCGLLEVLEAEGPAAGTASDGIRLFLAETTVDLQEQREAVKRDLQQHGYTVLPDREWPLTDAELKAAVREDLAPCLMSIHMIGRNYGLVPEGCIASLLEIQNDLAIERAGQGGFSRLVWIPPGLQVDDERQRKVIDALRTDPRMHRGADLLETPLEELRTVIDAWLARARRPSSEPAKPGTTVDAPQLYLIYDQRDAGGLGACADYLFGLSFEVIHPVFEGDEAEVREYHEETLRSCDGALIFFGAGNECWLRRKLREIQKSAGYGRTKAPPTVGICLVPPKTAEKERFRTHEAIVIPQWDGFSSDALQPFVTSLKGGKEGRQGDAGQHPA